MKKERIRRYNISNNKVEYRGKICSSAGLLVSPSTSVLSLPSAGNTDFERQT